jgi:hypothetical protein
MGKANRIGKGKSQYFVPPKKRRKGYHAKSFSDRIWTDEYASADTNTRQRLKRSLQRELERGFD